MISPSKGMMDEECTAVTTTGGVAMLPGRMSTLMTIKIVYSLDITKNKEHPTDKQSSVDPLHMPELTNFALCFSVGCWLMSQCCPELCLSAARCLTFAYINVRHRKKQETCNRQTKSSDPRRTTQTCNRHRNTKNKKYSTRTDHRKNRSITG